jgi:hypothetical protein
LVTACPEGAPDEALGELPALGEPALAAELVELVDAAAAFDAPEVLEALLPHAAQPNTTQAATAAADTDRIIEPPPLLQNQGPTS